jgi:hypothetical protein
VLFDILFKSDVSTLRKYLTETLTSCGYTEQVEGEDYVYFKGTLPVLVCAHMDVVHTEKLTDLVWDKENGILWSPQGLGADDRAGILAILSLVNQGHRPHVLFLDKEERGCIGAKAAAKELPAPAVHFVLEFDRRGKEDCVFYQCDNPEFTEYIESFGFKTALGSCSDISHLCPTWGIAGANLSVGYYNEHTKTEFLRLAELNATIEKASKILSSLPQKPFKYIAKVYPKAAVTAYDTNFWNNKWYNAGYGDYGGGVYTKKSDKKATTYYAKTGSSFLYPDCITSTSLFGLLQEFDSSLDIDIDYIEEILWTHRREIREVLAHENLESVLLYILDVWESETKGVIVKIE